MLTDIHNHILPNVDDGPQSIEESISLLKSAKKNKITTIYCTPHKNKFHVELSSEQIKRIYHKFIMLDEVKNLDLNIKLAQEVTIKPKLWESIQKNEIFLLSNKLNKQYMLLELPSSELPEYLEETIHKIIALDIVPIIVHPERQNELRKEMKIVHQLLDLGAEFQVNADSFLGKNGYTAKRFVYKLFKNDLINYIASDAHNTTDRDFVINQVLNKLYKKNEVKTKKIITTMNNF
jgi:protein-tyrosine phosphatase